jgi:hypothetical protein
MRSKRCPWTRLLSWLFRVMAVFFLVGGYANAASLTSHRCRGGTATTWLVARTNRLRPTTAFIVTLASGALCALPGPASRRGFIVNTVALQVPILALTEGREKVIGVWSTTSRRDADDDHEQISWLGMPLVNEVVIPLKDKDRFNASKPMNERQFARYVTHPELPKLIQAWSMCSLPACPR